MLNLHKSNQVNTIHLKNETNHSEAIDVHVHAMYIYYRIRL